jgi:hypothetical protein
MGSGVAIQWTSYPKTRQVRNVFRRFCVGGAWLGLHVFQVFLLELSIQNKEQSSEHCAARRVLPPPGARAHRRRSALFGVAEKKRRVLSVFGCDLHSHAVLARLFLETGAQSR